MTNLRDKFLAAITLGLTGNYIGLHHSNIRVLLYVTKIFCQFPLFLELYQYQPIYIVQCSDIQREIFDYSSESPFNPLMPGGNKKVTHTCVTLLLPPGIKGLKLS